MQLPLHLLSFYFPDGGIHLNKRQLRKSSTNRSLYGVCGGIAAYYNVSPFLVRLLFVFTPIPISVLVYTVLANTLPENPPSL